MTKGIYGFEAIFYDEDTGEKCKSCGMVAGGNYNEVMDKVNNFFGEDCIFSIKLQYKDDGELIFVPQDFYNKFMDDKVYPHGDYMINLSKVKNCLTKAED